jgi:FMN phosphatase YigB (HAD superfamily)
MRTTEIRAVLFDVDDTLFDREEAQKKTLERIVARFTLELGCFEMSRLREAREESDRFATEDFEASVP